MVKVFPICLAIAAIINFIPVVGVYSKSTLELLYQVELANADLVFLLRHRAVMFGLIGILLFYSLVKPQLRLFAASIGLTSMLSFSFLAWQLEIHNDKLQQLAIIDLIVSLVLILGIILHRYQVAALGRVG